MTINNWQRKKEKKYAYFQGIIKFEGFQTKNVAPLNEILS